MKKSRFSRLSAGSSKKPRRTLMVESLEDRRVLATAVPDVYTGLTEDTPFATGFQSVLATNASYRYFDAITTTPGQDSYPTDATPGDDWNDPGYDVSTSSFGTWKTGNGPFAGPANNAVNEFVANTVITQTAPNLFTGANPTRRTPLLRTTFTLDAGQAAATTLRIRNVCDDACAFYINGQQVHIDAGLTDPTNAQELSTVTGGEDDFRNTDVAVTAGLLVAGTNTFAVELHNGTNSSDLGFGAEILVAGGAAGVLANDTIAVGGVIELYDAITNMPIAGNTVVAVDDTTLQPAGVVTMDLATGNFAFAPGRNYNGTALFLYQIRDTPGGPVDGPVTVNLVVGPANDGPRALNDQYAFQNTGAAVSVGNRGVALVEPGAGGWFYKADGSDQDTRNPFWNDGPVGAFDPAGSGWNGPARAQLGFGEGDETTPITNSGATPLDPGGLAYYFFRSFNVTNPTTVTHLEVELLRDDGAAVFINGVRVILDGMIDPVTYTTAATNAADDGQAFNRTILDLAALGITLSPTGNHLAVQVNQTGSGSSDVSFDIGVFEHRKTTGPSSGATGVLANDTDIDDLQSTLVVDSFDNSANAASITAVINADGTFTITPVDASIGGTFTIPYVIKDPHAGSPTSTANLVVTLSPLIQTTPDTYQVDEDRVLNTSAGASTVLLPRSTAGWSFLDQINNGLEGDPDNAPEDYPVDGSARPWFHSAFDTATSTIGPWGAGATPLQSGGITAFGTLPDAFAPLVCAVPATEGNCVTTYLFRRTFNVPGGASLQSLMMNVIADDGFRVYMNGVEVQRHLLNPGAVATTTFATGNGNEGAVGGPYDVYFLDVAGVMVNGDNVIAVEVHQVNATSSDIGLDLELATWPGVLANDSSPNPPLSASLTTQATNGVAVVNLDGSFTYTPNPNFFGADTFQYTATDGVNPPSAPTTVTINVRNRPDAPTANPDTYMVDNASVLAVTDVLLGLAGNDTDPDGTAVTQLAGVQAASISVAPPTAGVFTPGTVAGGLFDGTFTFDPDNAFTGNAVVTYTVQDNSGLTSTSTATIMVTSSCGFNSDLNGSGNVNRRDVITLLTNYGGAGTPAQGDINCDGTIGLLDLGRLQSAYTGIAPSPGAASAATQVAVTTEASTGSQTPVQPERTVRAVRATARTTPRVAADRPAPREARPLQARRAPRPAAHDRAMEQMFG